MTSLSKIHRRILHPARGLRRVPAYVSGRLWGGLLAGRRTGNIALFHIGRSGSTVLGDLLDQQPEVFWGGEIFTRFRKRKRLAAEHWWHRPPPSDPLKYLQNEMRIAGRKMYGFETKFYQVEERLQMPLGDYVSRLETMGFTHFIMVERKNYLRKLASTLIARQTQKWHHYNREKAALRQVEIPIDRVQIERHDGTMLDLFSYWKTQFEEMEQILNSRTSLKLTYEDDIMSDPIIAHRKACEFLGIVPRAAKPHFSKSNPFPIQEMISNFDAVAEVLRGTEYAWMLKG